MKKMLFIASALLMIGAGSAWAQNNNEQIPYVEINSSADTAVMPNKFRISISISEAPSKGKTTIAELERSLATALNAAGVDIKKQLVITSQSNANGKRKDIYQYKNYLLTLTEPNQVETVFDELQANGISNASLSQSLRSDARELRVRMRVKAMQNAQQTAAELAAAIGQRIGKAIYINAYTTITRQLGFATASVRAKNSVQTEDTIMPKVQFEDVKIEENVTVRFVLE